MDWGCILFRRNLSVCWTDCGCSANDIRRSGCLRRRRRGWSDRSVLPGRLAQIPRRPNQRRHKDHGRRGQPERREAHGGGAQDGLPRQRGAAVLSESRPVRGLYGRQLGARGARPRGRRPDHPHALRNGAAPEIPARRREEGEDRKGRLAPSREAVVVRNRCGRGRFAGDGHVVQVGRGRHRRRDEKDRRRVERNTARKTECGRQAIHDVLHGLSVEMARSCFSRRPGRGGRYRLLR
mmetsp:Transcript_47466/g.92687  ORF Transcript_47466/g.92687 Transcript_47466/m.92687 type:complete len:237 (+) Transcript_47466:193-903(+)